MEALTLPTVPVVRAAAPVPAAPPATRPVRPPAPEPEQAIALNRFEGDDMPAHVKARLQLEALAERAAWGTR